MEPNTERVPQENDSKQTPLFLRFRTGARNCIIYTNVDSKVAPCPAPHAMGEKKPIGNGGGSTRNS